MAEPPPSFLNGGSGQFWWNGTAWVATSATNPQPVNATVSASVSGFTPNGNVATPLAVTGTTGRVALPAGTSILISNPGATTAYVRLGDVTVAATTSDIPVQAGGAVGLTVGANTHLAAITASSTTTINLAGGAGLFTGTGGTSAGGVANTVTLAAGTAAVGTIAVSGTVPVSGTVAVSGTSAVSGTVGISAGAATIGALVANQSVNLTQVAGATAATGHGVAATALRVELPTDGTGVVGLAAGVANVGSVVVSSGTVVNNGGSVTLVGTSAISGTVAATQSGTWTGVTITPSGTQTVGGQAASGATAAGNPLRTGARAATASPTAVTDGQIIDILTDKIGRIINGGFAIPENNLDGYVTSTATTAATIIASQGTGASIYLTDLELSNTSTTQTVITLNNAAATQLSLPASGGREIHLLTPIKIAANTALTFTMTPAVSSVLAGAQGFKAV